MRGKARMPGPSFNFQLSTLDCELLVLTMSTHAAPMFTLTDSASRPKISALDRAGRLEMQTHQKCPPGPISPLECTDTKNASASPLECTDTKSLDLKSFRFHCYKKRGVGGASRYQRAHQLRRRECLLRRSRACFLGSVRPSRRQQVLYCCQFGAERFHRQEVPCPDRRIENL